MILDPSNPTTTDPSNTTERRSQKKISIEAAFLCSRETMIETTAEQTIDPVLAQHLQSHASQWENFLRKHNSQQDDSIHSSLVMYRLDFQDPFSVQVEGGDGFTDDWYLPAHVNVEYYHDSGHIKSLDFRSCSFAAIPDSVWELLHLEKVEMHAMEDLMSLTENATNDCLQRSNLKELIIDECYSLDKLPPLPDSLTSISIKACHRMSFLPQSVVEATNLKTLQISNMMLPMGPSLPSSLEDLQINGSEIRIRKLKRYLDGGESSSKESGRSNLKSLRLSMCDLKDDHMKGIWHEILPICPQLQRLNLSGNAIESLSSLVVNPKSSMTTTTTTRLRAINLEANPVVSNHGEDTSESNHLLALLEQNHELCCLGANINWNLPLYQKHSKALQMALDRNFARILKASSSCPLALWSNVLCTAHNNGRSGGVTRCKNNNSDADRASLIYNVLHGPAFVERFPHTYHHDC